MLRSLLLLTLALLSVTLFARADSKDEAVQKDLDALAGTWDSTGAKSDSKEGVPVFGPHVTFSGKTYLLTIGSKKLQFESGTLAIDPSKTPKTLDYVSTKGLNKGKKIQAIYELTGDDLKVAITPPGKDRPTDFSGKDGAAFTYKRAKP